MLKNLKRKMVPMVFTLSILILQHGISFAESVGMSGESMDIQWPWMKFLNSLAKQFTGPLPLTLGTLGLAGCAIALFSGHAGGGTQKFIVLIFAVSTCLFAPSFITFISTSAGGLTIMGIMP